jgi:hypothetical protein
VVVKRINFDLEIRVIVKECRVAVSCTFQLLSHVHDLVFFGSDLAFEVLDGCGKLHVPRTFSIDSLLEVGVLMSVLFLQALQMVQLVLETDYLVLQLDDFAFTIDKLGLLVLQIISF